ncbi:PRTRC system protein B [Rugamonas aquatica]|uniref:PRTRC system protein B n=1 Tax=Rugamonas aquatica TaxID=2743357 RepID=A0A6A7N6F6_9BURK|nr:PRTRC system protein B [Rugamonas aquatica]MQA40569.1 PRTRC system protein B [Rugamonas aquatica]
MDPIPFAISTNREQSLPLRRAILLYQHGGGSSATVHDIATVDGVSTILPGCAVHSGAVHALASALGERAEPAGFLPPELLWHDGRQLLWWLPPGRRHIVFRVPEFGGDRHGVLPHPGLVFHASPQRWMAWAVKGGARPTPLTALWRAPYFNVHLEGDICAGTGEVPQHYGVDALDDWNHAFFGSAFSHLTDKEPLVAYEQGPGSFWLAMLGGAWDRFPQKVLVPSVAGTVGEQLARLVGARGGRR